MAIGYTDDSGFEWTNQDQARISEENDADMAQQEQGTAMANARPLPNDWNDALQAQERERAYEEQQNQRLAEAQRVNANRGVYENYVKMHQKTMGEQAQRVGRAGVHLLSAAKLASGTQNLGVPQEMLTGLNDALGYDGQTSAVIGGGWGDNGKFGLVIAQKDPQTGQISRSVKEFSGEQLYNMGLENPGVYDRNEMETMRGRIIDREHMTDDMAAKRLPSPPENYGFSGPNSRSVSFNGAQAARLFGFGGNRRRGGSAFSADGRGGFTRTTWDGEGNMRVEESGTANPSDPRNWKYRGRDDGRQMTKYENARTGEVIYVPDGSSIASVAGGGSEKERVARINADGRMQTAEIQEKGRNERADKANETKMSIADAANVLKKAGIEIDKGKLDEAIRHNQATEAQAAENEKGRTERADRANETKRKIAEVRNAGNGTRRRAYTPTDYANLTKIINDPLNDDGTREEARKLRDIVGKALEGQGVALDGAQGEAQGANKGEIKGPDNVTRPTKEEWAKMTTDQKREWLKKNAK